MNDKGTLLYCHQIIFNVTPNIAMTFKFLERKNKDIWHLALREEKIWFLESPPNIMVNRNPNWLTHII